MCVCDQRNSCGNPETREEVQTQSLMSFSGSSIREVRHQEPGTRNQVPGPEKLRAPPTINQRSVNTPGYAPPLDCSLMKSGAARPALRVARWHRRSDEPVLFSRLSAYEPLLDAHPTSESFMSVASSTVV